MLIILHRKTSSDNRGPKSLFGMSNSTPTECQEKKNTFEDYLLNGYSIEDAAFAAYRLEIHQRGKELSREVTTMNDKTLVWTVYNLCHHGRMAVIVCEADRRVVFCRGWKSEHGRDHLYDADFRLYFDSYHVKRKAPGAPI